MRQKQEIGEKKETKSKEMNHKLPGHRTQLIVTDRSEATAKRAPDPYDGVFRMDD
jgi:hypothetical protein